MVFFIPVLAILAIIAVVSAGIAMAEIQKKQNSSRLSTVGR